MKNDKRVKKKILVTLDIGTSNIKVVVGKRQGGKIIVKEMIAVQTPEKCLSNGYIRDLNAIKEVLSKIVHDYKLKGKYTVVTIKSSGIINRELSLPYNDDLSALDRIIHYEMKQFLTIKLDEYVTQYQIIDEYYDEKVKMMKVLVTAVNRELVDTYYNLLKSLHLKPYALDVHFNSINKFFRLYNDNVVAMENTVAVIDIGYNSSDISIISGGTFNMSRTIMLGSNSMEHMLKEEFNVDFENGQIRRLIIKDGEQFSHRINDVLTPLVDEISNVIRYHLSRDSSNSVDNIYITGGIINQPEIKDLLIERLDLPTFEFESLENIITNTPITTDVASYFPVLGAMVRL
ncbi:type IV pilus assembly protein PilM [Acidaminobacter sp. JC074]|uniref:type IV pilus assembly protein PilM n=1 Tax=Acidaminobacter sp. JC074 TaxID=2530199 RepID=UPI001F0DE2AC|nr:type IV pilus assembly protein PilM [Acidaminobacter sp. JC074]